MKETIDIGGLIDTLAALHAKSCDNLRAALAAYINGGERPDPVARAAGAFCYPEIRVVYAPETANWPAVNRAFARMNGPGAYAVSITRPEVFRDYLIEQLTLLSQDYGVQIEVGLSSHEIPYPYVLDGSEDLPIDQAGAAELSRWFPTSALADIGDEVPDGVFVPAPDKPLPLALFEAPRIDFSLKRLQHYTGAPAEHTQQYILFTNYHRYVDEFVRWASAELKRPGSPYVALSCSGNVIVDASTPDPEETVAAGAWRRHQMPAYHLMAPNGRGVTLVNIGVGPSNAKTICDHLAVLRPQAWLMIGHCGGLRGSQKLGDYVLAHAYLRDDHALDHLLPIEIPIPPIAEVQQALQKAAEIVTGETREQLKARLRTGTIVTTDDRNWELRYSLSAVRFNQSRAVGIDMESATIAAQGYRFRVPYGTLLCVSDKPLHGEIKLPGQANRFYEQAIGQHLKIGIEAVELLRREGPRLHSRKLRAFDEPPFR